MECICHSIYLTNNLEDGKKTFIYILDNEENK